MTDLRYGYKALFPPITVVDSTRPKLAFVTFIKYKEHIQSFKSVDNLFDNGQTVPIRPPRKRKSVIVLADTVICNSLFLKNYKDFVEIHYQFDGSNNTNYIRTEDILSDVTDSSWTSFVNCCQCHSDYSSNCTVMCSQSSDIVSDSFTGSTDFENVSINSSDFDEKKCELSKNACEGHIDKRWLIHCEGEYERKVKINSINEFWNVKEKQIFPKETCCFLEYVKGVKLDRMETKRRKSSASDNLEESCHFDIQPDFIKSKCNKYPCYTSATSKECDNRKPSEKIRGNDVTNLIRNQFNLRLWYHYGIQSSSLKQWLKDTYFDPYNEEEELLTDFEHKVSEYNMYFISPQ